jgi:putative tryptophan/tyrosine transport system substrate-binding protein
MIFGCTTILWPWIAIAQQSSGKVWRVGYRYAGALDNPTDRAAFDVFRAEMRDLGYTEGKNLAIDSRDAGGNIERLPSLAKELVALRPDVIVAVATPAIAAARDATSNIPVVMSPATDAVGSGFIKNLDRPGGNITGISNMMGDTIGKLVELLHSIVPSATRIAVLMSSANPTHPQMYGSVAAAAKSLNLATVRVVASTPGDLEEAFEKIKQEKCDALYVLADATRPLIVKLADTSKIPAIYQFSSFVELGGLASYGADLKLVFREAAHYVEKIFNGANPAELPVEQPVVFELALNLKTAASLGITIPASIISRADKIIE